MSSEAEQLDLPLQLDFKGKVYELSRIITFGMETAVGDWVYFQALSNLERARERAREQGFGMTDEQYVRQLDRIADNFAAGMFSWGGEITMKAIDQLPANKYLIWQRFLRFDGSIKMELIDEIFKDKEAARKLGLLLNPTKAAGDKQEQKKEQETPAASKD